MCENIISGFGHKSPVFPNFSIQSIPQTNVYKSHIRQIWNLWLTSHKSLVSKQTIATQAKKAEKLISNQVVYGDEIKMTGEDIFDFGVENEALRGKLGEVDEKWLSESKTRIKLSYDDTRKKRFILERMKDKNKNQKRYKNINYYFLIITLYFTSTFINKFSFYLHLIYC